MLALTPPPDRAIPVLWQNFIRTFNVPGRLDTVPSAHSRSLAYVLFLPQTRTPLRVGAKCGRPHRGSNRALTTGTSVGFRRYIHSATDASTAKGREYGWPVEFEAERARRHSRECKHNREQSAPFANDISCSSLDRNNRGETFTITGAPKIWKV